MSEKSIGDIAKGVINDAKELNDHPKEKLTTNWENFTKIVNELAPIVGEAALNAAHTLGQTASVIKKEFSNAYNNPDTNVEKRSEAITTDLVNRGQSPAVAAVQTFLANSTMGIAIAGKTLVDGYKDQEIEIRQATPVSPKAVPSTSQHRADLAKENLQQH